jgi:hypothetical protein
MRRNAPKSVIKRLPVYLRILDNLIRRDVEIISSRVLSEETGFTAEQIRKDLAYFNAEPWCSPVNMPACQAGDRGFDSRRLRHKYWRDSSVGRAAD